MSLLLTDCPHRLEPFLGPVDHWQRATAGDLPVAGQAIWQAVGAGPRLWWTRRDAAAGQRRDLVQAFIEHAPGSQFKALQQALRQGAELGHGVACLAFSGDGFCGQRQRAWATAAGNLHLSLAAPVRAPVSQVIPALSMVPAVAVVRAVRRWLGPGARQPRIKWVNDILLDQRKVAGVLTATQIRGLTVEHALFGVGINVEQAPDVAATPFVPRVGCLRQFQPPGDAAGELGRVYQLTLDRLLHTLEGLRRDGPADVARRYRESSAVIGRRVEIYPEDADGPNAELLARGVVRAINDDLTLTLEGQPEPVTRGRLVLLDGR